MIRTTAGGLVMSRKLLKLCSLVLALCALATPAHAQFDAAFRKIKFGGNASTTPILYSGSGTPEANVTAPPGSLYGRTDTGTLYIKNTGTGNTGWVLTSVGATVSSVALTMPGVFSVGGSPVTGSGTLAVTFATQSANTVFAGPTTGSAATPAFRALVAADIPSASIDFSKWTSNSCSNGDVPQWSGSSWGCAAAASPLTTKGDLFVFSTTNARKAVGSDGQYLMADSGDATGVSWQTVAPGSGASASATYVTTASEAGLSNETTLGSAISTNAYASLPSAAVAGKLFLPTDSYYIFRDTGAVWAAWGPIYQLTVPDDTAFSWVNQSTASTSATKGGVTMNLPKSTGTQLHLRVKTAPSTPYTIIAAFLPNWIHLNSGQHVGLLFRESSSGKIQTCETWVESTSPFSNFTSSKFTSATAFSADYQARTYFPMSPVWIRIQDDGSNRTCSLSSDGQNWIVEHSVTRLDFLTTGANQVGWFGEEQTNTYDWNPTLISWKEQ